MISLNWVVPAPQFLPAVPYLTDKPDSEHTAAALYKINNNKYRVKPQKLYWNS